MFSIPILALTMSDLGDHAGPVRAAGLPKSPEVQYRLGLASLKVGDKEGARRAPRVLAGSAASFGGRDETRRLLAGLK